ncbi:PLDc N-terminal domain-containing protein [Microbulbifer echini]|uniref:PLDc N-terminal domain-containing protein n=1 Tax=Microbulbifer echini TaxID=1529067 RepID=A0ABV4NMN1_9GAMM|nr:PLDc N-terminal domain-containing protein [uncultured Microbulbifer sp.]
MDIQVGGILGFLILVADIWAILNIVQSGSSTGSKLIWILLVLFLPVIGLILWFLLGPKSARA